MVPQKPSEQANRQSAPRSTTIQSAFPRDTEISHYVPNGYVSDKSPKSAVFPLLSTVAYSITFKLAGFVLPPNTIRRVPVPKFDESHPFDDTKSPPRY